MKQVIDNKKKKSLPKGIRHLASGKFIADVCINGKRKTKTVDTLEEAILPQVTLPPPLPLVMMLICVHWICFSNERIIFTGKTPHGEKLQKIIISNCPPFSVVAIIFPLQP